MLGWRIWRLRGDSLQSWTVRHPWGVGENRARCLARWHCPFSPGPGCHCGLWAVFHLEGCLRRGHADSSERACVFGLVRAWGELAIHGTEGFRAEKATVACVFTDRIWDRSLPSYPRQQFSFRHWLRSSSLRFDAPRAGSSRLTQLSAVASRYGVPVASLRDALDNGLLSELGVQA